MPWRSTGRWDVLKGTSRSCGHEPDNTHLVVGCSGTRSETSKKEQGSSPEAAASEEARCEGPRNYHLYAIGYSRGGEGLLRTGSEEDMKKALKKARHIAKTEG